MEKLLAQNFTRASETATNCTDAKRDDKTREDCRVNAKAVHTECDWQSIYP